jgi:hypothetical protein
VLSIFEVIRISDRRYSADIFQIFRLESLYAEYDGTCASSEFSYFAKLYALKRLPCYVAMHRCVHQAKYVLHSTAGVNIIHQIKGNPKSP